MIYVYVTTLLLFLQSNADALFILPDKYEVKAFNLINSTVKSEGNTSWGSVSFLAAGKSLKVIIFKSSLLGHELFHNKTKLETYADNGNERLNLGDLSFATGFVDGARGFSFVDGYVENGQFYGKIGLDFDVYYIERYWNSSKYNAVIYKNSGRFPNFPTGGVSSRSKRSPNRQFRRLIQKRHICSLLVLLDYSFLSKIHKNNLMSAIGHVTMSINEANSIFRSTDFDEDGTADNIGFRIDNMIAISSQDSPMNLFPNYRKSPMQAGTFLNHFTFYKVLRDVCLGVVFTAQSFQSKAIGISYSSIPKGAIGGICQRPFGRLYVCLNVLAVSYGKLVEDKRHSQEIFDLCLAHELGHAFGAYHDDNRCKGYLMAPEIQDEYKSSSFYFSPCSKPQVVDTVASRGYCLEESDKPFCGNRIIEEGEDCDCGSLISCMEKDPCCVPGVASRDTCKVNFASGHRCHPSQGPCCTSKCQFEDLSRYNLNCKNMMSRCPCKSGTTSCSCGVEGACINSECHHVECARINTIECGCEPGEFSCQACCKYLNECLPSDEVTEALLGEGVVSLDVLKSFHVVNRIVNLGEYKKLCKGGACVTLFFRKPQIGEYCTKAGKIGKCQKYGCQLKITQKFPSIRLLKSKNASARTLPRFETEIIIIIFILYCNKFIKLCAEAY